MFCIGVRIQRFARIQMLSDFGYIKSVIVIYAAVSIADTNHFISLVVQNLCGNASDVSEPLYGKSVLFARFSEIFKCVFNCSYNAVCGSGSSAERTAYFKRLARYDSGALFSVKFGIFVHNPTHNFAVRVYIGSGNVYFGADDSCDFIGEFSCQSFKFSLGKLFRIDGYTALTTAVRNVGNGTLKAHP